MMMMSFEKRNECEGKTMSLHESRDDPEGIITSDPGKIEEITCPSFHLAPASPVLKSNCDNILNNILRTAASNSESNRNDSVAVVQVPVRKSDTLCNLSQQQQPTKPNQPKKRNFIVQYFKRKSQNWSRRQFVTILILSFVEFFASAVVSIQAPFYPDIARRKGATASEYGLVFGIFEITVFIISPIYGSKMRALGPTRVFNCGILVTGVCCIIFGLLDEIEGRAPFIWTCVIVRVVEAMGDAAFETASFTIIAAEFPNAVATNFSILEIWYGLGLIIGPTLGGALYQLGGYRLPFMSMGGLLFLSAIATYFYLPEPNSRQKSKSEDKTTELSCEASEDKPPVDLGGFHMFLMLKIPVIAMTAYSIVAATAGVGFLSANLDLHLEQFQLNKLEVGLVFVLNGGIYAVTAPVWGWICDHTSQQKMITLIGAIFTILGFILIGPVPYFPYDTTLFCTCLGLALFGFGLAATLVSAFLQLLNDAIDHGYPDDISTYGCISGLWTSMAALGYFIGPSLGGVLDDWVGFRWCSVVVIGGQVVLIMMLVAYYVSRSLRSKQIFHFNMTGENKEEDADFKNHNSIRSRNTHSQNNSTVPSRRTSSNDTKQDFNRNGLNLNKLP